MERNRIVEGTQHLYHEMEYFLPFLWVGFGEEELTLCWSLFIPPMEWQWGVRASLWLPAA